LRSLCCFRWQDEADMSGEEGHSEDDEDEWDEEMKDFISQR
jgi:hypothetical protein